MTVQVESVHLYPIKASGPVTVASAAVELAGLRHDRRWAIVDPTGVRLNATTHDTLLGVTATPDDGGALRLTAEGRPDLEVAVPVGGRSVPVDVTRLPTAIDAGDAAAEWFSALLGEPVRLVWQDDTTRRPISASHGGQGGEPLSLADTAPLLLTSTASLARLNEWIAADHEPQDMVMGRFRPNVVVSGDLAPFVEDDWRRLHIGGVPYRFAEHCDRCVVTTIDPGTRAHGKEPIRTLARHRKWDGKTWFGIRIVPLTIGVLSVGDSVTIDA
ncbi:MAG: uncharacterized protein QOJ72_2129 [Nocardioidaceae bacterium]|nr:uncharacterized protein [Nocardioidaceae bacterium]